MYLFIYFLFSSCLFYLYYLSACLSVCLSFVHTYIHYITLRYNTLHYITLHIYIYTHTDLLEYSGSLRVIFQSS